MSPPHTNSGVVYVVRVRVYWWRPELVRERRRMLRPDANVPELDPTLLLLPGCEDVTAEFLSLFLPLKRTQPN